MNDKHPTPGSFGVEGRPTQSNEEAALQDALAVFTYIIQDENWGGFWKWANSTNMFVKGELEEGDEDFDLEEGLRENFHIDAHVVAGMIQRLRQVEISSRNQLN